MTYNQKDVKALLDNKFVVILGDSITRGAYKDLVTLIAENRLLKDSELAKKGEPSHCGDVNHEQSELVNAKYYREVRQYQTPHHLVRFYFITRIYSDYVETILADLSKEPSPDVVIVNSCLWDMSRYGADGDVTYRENLQMFFTRCEQVLPEECLLIWLSGLPVGNEPKAGVLPRNLAFLGGCYPSMVRVANFYAAQVARAYERNFIDAHYEFTSLPHLRVSDDIHWNPVGHRFLTNIILKHIADVWDVERPRSSYFHDDDMEIIKAQYKQQNMGGEWHKGNRRAAEASKAGALSGAAGGGSRAAPDSTSDVMMSGDFLSDTFDPEPYMG